MGKAKKNKYILEDMIVDPPVFKKLDKDDGEIPRHKAGDKPDYIDHESDFVDPNADPGTQA